MLDWSFVDFSACTVQQRHLSLREATAVINEIVKTPKITGYDKFEWTRTKTTFVAQSRGANSSAHAWSMIFTAVGLK